MCIRDSFHVCLLGRDAQYHHDRYYHHGKYQRASHIDVVPLPVGKLADAAEIACGKDGGIHRNVSQGRYIRRFLYRGVLKKLENHPSAKYEMLNCVCTYRAVSAVPYGNITAEKHKRRYICHRKQQRNTERCIRDRDMMDRGLPSFTAISKPVR